jgi:hypothetical protein
VRHDVGAAPVEALDAVRDRWDESPLRRAVPWLSAQLEDTAKAGDLIAVVTDGFGRVIWQWSPRWLWGRAERIGFQPGGVWNESTMGTNGIGLALAADMPAVVFATEHWMDRARDWVCYSSPVHAADGTQLGVLDLSTKWDHANPLGLTTVATMARVVEHELRQHPDRPVVDGGRPSLSLRLLGRPYAALGGQPLPLSLRQFEILAILATVRTATLAELHGYLYGDRPVTATTLKVEISHLRRALGGQIASRPYRLLMPCESDAHRLLDRLDVGDPDGAAELYRGQLLPDSEAPLIVELRHHIDVALRTAVLRSGSTAALLRYAGIHRHDIEVLQRANGIADPDDPLLPTVAAGLAVALAYTD